MGRVFAWSDEDLKKLKSFAEAPENWYNKANMIKVRDGVLMPVGEIEGYQLKLVLGYKVVYSIEEHPGGWARHMSMSTSDGTALHPFQVQMMLEGLGFETNITNGKRAERVWMEANPGGTAFQIIEFFDIESLKSNEEETT